MAVSGFRLREGNEIGCRVTLRGQRMYRVPRPAHQHRPAAYSRLSRHQSQELRRPRQLQLGLSEQLVFPEIDPDKVTFTQGMDITFVTSTNSDDEARELLRLSACRSGKRKSNQGLGTASCQPKRSASSSSAIWRCWKPTRRIRPRRSCGRATGFAFACAAGCAAEPRAVYRKFGICRICFRDMASKGLIPGVKKASW